MDTVSDIAIVIALVRDIVFLLLLAVALTLMLVMLAMLVAVRRLLGSVEETAETVQEAVKKVSENLVEPAAADAGTARKVGRAAGFLWGFFGGRRKSSDKN